MRSFKSFKASYLQSTAEEFSPIFGNKSSHLLIRPAYQIIAHLFEADIKKTAHDNESKALHPLNHRTYFIDGEGSIGTTSFGYYLIQYIYNAFPEYNISVAEDALESVNTGANDNNENLGEIALRYINDSAPKITFAKDTIPNGSNPQFVFRLSNKFRTSKNENSIGYILPNWSYAEVSAASFCPFKLPANKGLGNEDVLYIYHPFDIMMNQHLFQSSCGSIFKACQNYVAMVDTQPDSSLESPVYIIQNIFGKDIQDQIVDLDMKPRVPVVELDDEEVEKLDEETEFLPYLEEHMAEGELNLEQPIVTFPLIGKHMSMSRWIFNLEKFNESTTLDIRTNYEKDTYTVYNVIEPILGGFTDELTIPLTSAYVKNTIKCIENLTKIPNFGLFHYLLTKRFKSFFTIRTHIRDFIIAHSPDDEYHVTGFIEPYRAAVGEHRFYPTRKALLFEEPDYKHSPDELRGDAEAIIKSLECNVPHLAEVGSVEIPTKVVYEERRGTEDDDFLDMGSNDSHEPSYFVNKNYTAFDDENRVSLLHFIDLMLYPIAKAAARSITVSKSSPFFHRFIGGSKTPHYFPCYFHDSLYIGSSSDILTTTELTQDLVSALEGCWDTFPNPVTTTVDSLTAKN